MHPNRLQLVLLALLALAPCLWAQDQEKGPKKARRPLVVTRRRHERDFLQALRMYQQDLPHEEWELERRLKYKLTNDDAGQQQQQLEVSYFVNDQLEADEFTYDHLVVGSLHQAYVARLYRSYMYTYDREEDRQRSSDKRLVSRQRCARDLRHMIENLPHKKPSINPELAALFDSSARQEAGLIMGNIHWSGNQLQCQRRLVIEPNHQNQSESVVYAGRYCIASIKNPNWAKLVRAQREKLLRADNYFKYPGQDHDYERFFRIQVGLCLPQSCDSMTIDWAHHQLDVLLKQRLSKQMQHYQLTHLFCLPDETSELRRLEPEGWLFVWCACLWLLAIALATLCDSDRLDKEEAKRPHGPWHKFLLAMSFKRNWRRLVALKESPEPGLEPAPCDLLFMNFFKVWCTPIIIWSHLGILSLELAKYTNGRNPYTHRLVFHSFNVAIFMTDTFFMMTGFVTCYLMLHQRMAQRSNLFAWLYSVFHRYWRLAPLYLVAFWYAKHIFMFTSHGSNWDYGTNNMTLRSICRQESWWYPLTLTSNFRPLHDECIMGSWYLGNDMQFYLITPFIMIGLVRWPRATWLACLSGLGLSSLLSFYKLYTSPRVSHLDLMRPDDDICRFNNWDIHEVYLHPQYRIGPYLVGLLAAHYIYMVLSGQWSSILYSHPNFAAAAKGKNQNGDKLGRVLLNLVFYLGLFIYLSATTATWQLENLPLPKSGAAIRLLASITYSVHHTYATLGLAMFFAGLMFGKAKRLRRFMAMPVWGMLSRLNFVIILVQVEVIWWLYLASNNTMNLTRMDYYMGFLAICFFSYLLSLILTPLLEQPLAQLEHQFVFSAIAPKKSSSSSSSSSQATSEKQRKKQE